MIMEQGELVHLSDGENPTILDHIYGEIEESKEETTIPGYLDIEVFQPK